MINQLLNALDERTIAREVAIAHDEARLGFRLSSNTVSDYRQFEGMIGEYYNFHFSRCVARGGSVSSATAESRAKKLLDDAYRRQGGDSVMAFHDAQDGTDGGMRSVLDKIADGMKEEAIQDYVQAAFDRYVKPSSWEDQLQIIREFITHYGHALGRSIDPQTPERYARDYRSLIQAYVDGLRQTSRIFRRLG